MNKKTIRDIDVEGKRALVRVDFNVPLDPDTGAILDDSRIKATLPTLTYLLDHGASLVICSHIGRPKGRVVECLRMAPISHHLASCIAGSIATATECVGDTVATAASRLRPGDMLMLENLRFNPGEEGNDPEFARSLASLGDIFVNDAFGTAHRAHASTVGVARCLPAVAGLLMEKELEFLGMAMENPRRPFTALLGGAKINDKMAVLERLLERLDVLLIGGGMAGTFLKAKGHEIGGSLLEEESLEFVSKIMATGSDRGIPVVLPVDVVVGDSFDSDATPEIHGVEDVPEDGHIMDIGPETVDLFEEYLKKSETVFWNGPMGVYEFPAFAQGTRRMAQVLAGLQATTVVGGGSTADAVIGLGLAGEMDHVSTGGGASLEFLEGKILPGVAALMDR
ncbi:MAG: phosphoglycerate kinase [Chloroflexi bacterium]|nr:phosphoglycerate kinase [Chloroflexota bacterium]